MSKNLDFNPEDLENILRLPVAEQPVRICICPGLDFTALCTNRVIPLVCVCPAHKLAAEVKVVENATWLRKLCYHASVPEKCYCTACVITRARKRECPTHGTPQSQKCTQCASASALGEVCKLHCSFEELEHFLGGDLPKLMAALLERKSRTLIMRSPV